MGRGGLWSEKGKCPFSIFKKSSFVLGKCLEYVFTLCTSRNFIFKDTFDPILPDLLFQDMYPSSSFFPVFLF